MKNKRLRVLLAILIIGLITLKVSGKLDDLIAYNDYLQGEKFEQSGQYELAEQKYLSALKIKPNDEATKSVLISFYQKVFEEYYDEADYTKTVLYGEKVLEMEPNNANNLLKVGYAYLKLNNQQKFIECCNRAYAIDPSNIYAAKTHNYITYYKTEQVSVEQPTSEPTKAELIYKYQSLFNKTYSEKNYKEAVSHGEQLMALLPNNIQDLCMIGYAYSKINNYTKSAEYYRKTLSFEPTNKYAIEGLKYVNERMESNNLNTAISNVSVRQKAPIKFYDLIKTSLSADVRKKAEGIIDLIWSEPVGQAMLSALWQYKIPINVIDSTGDGEFVYELRGSKITGKINIPVSYIQKLDDNKLHPEERLHYMNVFMHEMGHAFVRTKMPYSKDSIEEELGVSMIGYNLSYKLITGRYLDKKQTQKVSLRVLRSSLNTDTHRKLPVYGGFNQAIKRLGIPMPYVEVYTDIPAMYKILLAEGDIKSLASLDKLVK